jgi:hypothetical protein
LLFAEQAGEIAANESLWPKCDPDCSMLDRTAAALAQSTSRERQYYYQVSACKAASHRDKDCICWHDEGTGPLADETESSPRYACHWRDKPIQPEPQGPSETAWALAQLLDGVQRHDLPNMTGLSDSDCDRIWAARPATTEEQQ